MPTTTTEDLFALPGITAHRQRRTERIAAVLDIHLPATPRGYALAHHFLEGAEQAARAKDASLLAWYRSNPGDNLDHLLDGAHVILRPRPEQRLRTDISDTEYYLAATDTLTPPPTARALVRAAVISATEHGFGPLLTHHAPVICLLDHRQLDESLHSWALTRLPGTVFTDYTDHPEVLARDLIHEAAHNWLNDALALHTVQLSDDIALYSPWRGTHRPAFGFLHACWAFALTVIYSHRALPAANQPAASFLSAYLRTQHDHVNAAMAQLNDALRLLPEGVLRARLHEAVSQSWSILEVTPVK